MYQKTGCKQDIIFMACFFETGKQFNKTVIVYKTVVPFQREGNGFMKQN